MTKLSNGLVGFCETKPIPGMDRWVRWYKDLWAIVKDPGRQSLLRGCPQLRDRTFSRCDWVIAKRSQSQEGIGGFVDTESSGQLSKIPGGRASCEDVPNSAIAHLRGPIGLLRNAANHGQGSVGSLVQKSRAPRPTYIQSVKDPGRQSLLRGCPQLRDCPFSRSDWPITKQSQSREGIGGFVGTKSSGQLSKIPGGRASCEDVPNSAIAHFRGVIGLLRNKANLGKGSVGSLVQKARGRRAQLIFKLSKIPGGRASCEDVPHRAIAHLRGPIWLLRNAANRISGRLRITYFWSSV